MLLQLILNLVLPRRCPVCGCRMNKKEGSPCVACYLHLPRTHYASFPYDNEMARLLWGKIPVERVAAFFYFKPQSAAARLVYQIKYNNKPELAVEVASRLTKESDFCDFFCDIDCIVPMPLARKREKERGYNQCLSIAEGLSRTTHIPVVADAVERISFKASQTKMNHWERIENVEGVFRLKNPEYIAGKHILLVDDIMTTGSTICSCAKELLRASNIKISIFTLGYTKTM